MSTGVKAPPDRERTATRLLRSSEKLSYDPAVDIDWDAPLVEDTYYGPPHRSSLYGTALWDGLTDHQRVELTKHEVASIASIGIWFETVLMQMLIRHAYDRDPRSGHVQYAYTEIGDECRHSVMFARMIDKFGCPAYGPGWFAHALGRVFKTISNGPLTFAGALFVEEILDAFQREAKDDESLQPLVRAVSHIHVVEEARHMRYAHEELARQWEKKTWLGKAYSRAVLAGACYFAAVRLIHPQAYAAAGLDPRQARKAARRNPNWRASMTWAGRKVMRYFDDLGLVSGPARFVYRRAGLLE